MAEHDWTSEILSRVDGVVDTVHDKAVIPIVTAVRAVVFGVIIAMMSLAAIILLAIALVRILNNYLPTQVWASDAIVGGLFLLVGLFLWTKCKKKRERHA